MNKDYYNITNIFNEIETELLKELKSNLQASLPNIDVNDMDWNSWQKEMIANLKDYRKKNIKIISKNKISKKDIKTILVAEYIKGNKNEAKKIYKAYQNGYRKNLSKEKRINDMKKLKEEINIKPSFNKINNRKLNAITKEATSGILTAQNNILRQTDDIYRKIIYAPQIYNNTTGTTWGAVDMATKKFVENGILNVKYKNGSKMNIASYSDMAIRTAGQRAYLAGEGSKRDEWDIHTVIVIGNNSACPLCIPYQNEVFVDDEYSSGTIKESIETGYPLLSEAIAGGLFHPNCRDTTGTYFEGVTNTSNMVDEEEQIRRYNLEQKQRYNERQIRKYKRLEAVSLDENNTKKYNEKVKYWQDRQRDFIKENNDVLKRNYEREKNRM